MDARIKALGLTKDVEEFLLNRFGLNVNAKSEAEIQQIVNLVESGVLNSDKGYKAKAELEKDADNIVAFANDAHAGNPEEYAQTLEARVQDRIKKILELEKTVKDRKSLTSLSFVDSYLKNLEKGVAKSDSPTLTDVANLSAVKRLAISEKPITVDHLAEARRIESERVLSQFYSAAIYVADKKAGSKFTSLDAIQAAQRKIAFRSEEGAGRINPDKVVESISAIKPTRKQLLDTKYTIIETELEELKSYSVDAENEELLEEIKPIENKLVSSEIGETQPRAIQGGAVIIPLHRELDKEEKKTGKRKGKTISLSRTPLARGLAASLLVGSSMLAFYGCTKIKASPQDSTFYNPQDSVRIEIAAADTTRLMPTDTISITDTLQVNPFHYELTNYKHNVNDKWLMNRNSASRFDDYHPDGSVTKASHVAKMVNQADSLDLLRGKPTNMSAQDYLYHMNMLREQVDFEGSIKPMTESRFKRAKEELGDVILDSRETMTYKEYTFFKHLKSEGFTEREWNNVLYYGQGDSTTVEKLTQSKLGAHMGRLLIQKDIESAMLKIEKDIDCGQLSLFHTQLIAQALTTIDMTKGHAKNGVDIDGNRIAPARVGYYVGHASGIGVNFNEGVHYHLGNKPCDEILSYVRHGQGGGTVKKITPTPDPVPDITPDPEAEPEIIPAIIPDIVPDVEPEPEVVPDPEPEVKEVVQEIDINELSDEEFVKKLGLVPASKTNLENLGLEFPEVMRADRKKGVNSAMRQVLEHSSREGSDGNYYSFMRIGTRFYIAPEQVLVTLKGNEEDVLVTNKDITGMTDEEMRKGGYYWGADNRMYQRRTHVPVDAETRTITGLGGEEFEAAVEPHTASSPEDLYEQPTNSHTPRTLTDEDFQRQYNNRKQNN